MDFVNHKDEEFYNRGLSTMLNVLNQIDDLDTLIETFAQTALQIFDCDRVFLLHPLDPKSDTFTIPVEATKPTFPGAFQAGVKMPMTAEQIALFSMLLSTDEAIILGQKQLEPVRHETPVFRDNVIALPKSAILRALYPRIGAPWAFGLHQCDRERMWTGIEQKLFHDLSKRLAETLSNRLLLRQLQEREEHLRKSEERLRISQEIAHVGTWDMDIATRDMVWSDELYRLMGVPPRTKPPTYENFMAHVHPDDLEKVLDALDASFERGEPFDIQHKVQRDDGIIGLVREIGRLYLGADGKPYRMISVVQAVPSPW